MSSNPPDSVTVGTTDPPIKHDGTQVSPAEREFRARCEQYRARVNAASGWQQPTIVARSVASSVGGTVPSDCIHQRSGGSSLAWNFQGGTVKGTNAAANKITFGHLITAAKATEESLEITGAKIWEIESPGETDSSSGDGCAETMLLAR